jgi:GH25 family lysozyme M1 (1,4-beta-N-acetylmuramidase)
VLTTLASPACALVDATTTTNVTGNAGSDQGVAGGSLSPSNTGSGSTKGMLANTCAAGTTAPGIDVSYYQGSIDWNAVQASGIAFTFVRVSDGATFSDPKFAANYAGAQTAGLIRGAYQFFRADQDIDAQANMMIAAVGTLQPGDLPPVLDVEVWA